MWQWAVSSDPGIENLAQEAWFAERRLWFHFYVATVRFLALAAQETENLAPESWFAEGHYFNL